MQGKGEEAGENEGCLEGWGLWVLYSSDTAGTPCWMLGVNLTLPGYAWETISCLEKVFGTLEKHLYPGQRSAETKQFLERWEPTHDHNQVFHYTFKMSRIAVASASSGF